MKRRLFNFLLVFGVLIAIFSTSCLKTNDIEYTPEREQQLFNDYVARLKQAGHTVQTTTSGINYVALEQGNGSFPVMGDTVSVQYAGYFVTGELFDASLYHSADSTYHFVYKEPEMIKGWDEMIGMMNVGKKIEFIVPSNLAYGATGYGSVPPYTSLIFVAKMMAIKPKVTQ
jgi:FKBP-type peptidyl-prolyl cis-trans isomerase FkpA